MLISTPDAFGLSAVLHESPESPFDVVGDAFHLRVLARLRLGVDNVAVYAAQRSQIVEGEVR